MNDSDEDNSIFDASADLFDDTETDLTIHTREEIMDSQSFISIGNKQSFISIDNKVTAVQAQDDSQPLELPICSNTLSPTGVTAKISLLSSDKADARLERVTLLKEHVEESNNEHFNSNSLYQPAYVNRASLEDSFESHPNKRYKLGEFVGEVSDDSDVDLALNKNVTNFDIINVSNHSSDEDICTVANQIAKDNKDSDRNICKFNTDFLTSPDASSLDEHIVNVRNNLCAGIDSNNENKMTANNSDCSALNELNNVSLYQEMITQDFEGKIDSGRASYFQTPSTSQVSSSMLLKTSKIICPFCNIHQDSLYLMEIHIDSMHSEFDNTEAVMKSNEDYDFQFVCPLCDLDLGDRVTLDLHLLAIHEEEHNVQACEPETCPLCGVTSISEDSMKLHIQTHSADQTIFAVSENGHGTVFSSSTTLGVMTCPVCELVMTDSDLLTSHVESHFNSRHNPGPNLVSGASGRQNSSKEDNTMKINATIEKDFPEFQKARLTGSQNNTPSTSKDKLTPTSSSRVNSSYKHQYERNLEKAVTKGQVSATDYHKQKLLMAETDLIGVDSGNTRTQGVIEKLQLLFNNQARQKQVAHLCSPTDHFSGSFGDKGWGCGYRNFQMLLSCLSRNKSYSQIIFPDKNVSIPSIPKIQEMIEAAWKMGFDIHGCKQFGGQLVNTSKWIGATEIVATLSSLGIKCLLADFHAPSAPDGTHPHLLEWVSDYFSSHRQDFIPPLILQHQGHSRTIVGVEKDRGVIKLLLFDPGTPRDQMVSIVKEQLSWKHIRMFRRTQAELRAKQYQLIAVLGLMIEREYEESKIVKSVKIS